MLICAYQIIQKQKELTPDLPQADLELAYVILKSGYKKNERHIKIYDKRACEEANKILNTLLLEDNLKDRVFELQFDIAMSSKDFRKAKTLLNEVQRTGVVPQIEINSRRGLLYYTTRQYKRVIRFFERLAKEDPEYKNDPVLLSAYARIGSVDKLHSYHKRQVERYPEHAWTLGNYASFLLNTIGDYEGAITYGKKALKQMDYPVARNITGLALLIKASNKFTNNEIDKSEKYYKEASSIGYSDYYVKKNCQKYCKNIDSMREYFDTEKVTL